MALIFTMSPATIFADSADITEETETVDIVKSRTIMCVDCSLKLKEEHFLDNLTWESSDTSIATVSQDGEVKALKPGTVTITASNSNSSDTCSVVVEDYAYLGGKDDRTLHRNHPEATTQYVRVYAYTSTNGEDIVLTYINYKIITNFDLYTLHNMTTGSVIQDPENYYEDLYDRAFWR